jgi:hypothetical protein
MRTDLGCKCTEESREEERCDNKNTEDADMLRFGKKKDPDA